MGAVGHKWICARGVIHILSATLVLSGVVSGCTTFSSSSKHADETKRVQKLESELRRHQKLTSTLKERNLVLERREQNRKQDKREEMPRSVVLDKVERSTVAEPSLAVKPAMGVPPPVLSSIVIKDIVGGPPAAVKSVGAALTGEHFLYSKVLETYRAKNRAEMQKTLQLLLKTYPDSVFADNALYLIGLLELEENRPELAMKYMDRVIVEYPQGNKAVSALFAKAVIEKRLQHPAQAKELLLRVRTLYPGSPEAARVRLELKLLESAADSRRES